LKKGILTILSVLLLVVLMAAPVLAYDSELVLENKDGEWAEINDDGRSGLLQFNSSGPAFDFDLSATGLDDTDYSLIYYADPWPGDNPGAFIGSGTATGGELSFSGALDLGFGLPHPDDSNVDGAKIWLVLSADYDEGSNIMTGWNPADYLFERNFITYSIAPPPPPLEVFPEAPDWWPSCGDFSLWVGGMHSYSLDGNALPAIDLIVNASYSGHQYKLRIVVEEGTTLSNPGILKMMMTPTGLRIQRIDGEPMTFGQPVIVYLWDDDAWVEVDSFTKA